MTIWISRRRICGAAKSISEVSGSRPGILHKKGGKAEWTLFHAAFLQSNSSLLYKRGRNRQICK